MSNITAYVGDHNKKIPDGETTHAVCWVTEHPQFNDQRGDNDVAIVHLCHPIQFSKSIGALSLVEIQRDTVH